MSGHTPGPWLRRSTDCGWGEVERVARAIARRIAKREMGVRYEGFESSHLEEGVDYAEAAIAALRTEPDPRDAVVEALKAALDDLEANDLQGVPQILRTAITAAEAGDD